MSEFETPAKADECYLQLAQLYILADKLQVPCLMNNIIDKFFEMKKKAHRIPQISAICHVYKNSMRNSPLRRLMVDWWAWHVKLEWYGTTGVRDTISKCPEFAVDLAIAFAARLANPVTTSPLDGMAESYYEKVEGL
jgi:hypothetical protein